MILGYIMNATGVVHVGYIDKWCYRYVNECF